MGEADNGKRGSDGPSSVAGVVAAHVAVLDQYRQVRDVDE